MKNFNLIASMLTITFLTTFVGYAQNTRLIKPLNTLINNYLELKEALVTGNGNAAASKGKATLASLNELNETDLNAAEAAYVVKLKYDSRHISEVSRIAHQREHFGGLSKNLFSLLKNLKINQMRLYWEFSTAGNAYFISDEEVSKDPYSGSTNGVKLKERLYPSQK